MDVKLLMEEARKIAENAYAPYSRFRVGAILLLSDQTIVGGINVENRSYGLSNCAERTALFTALSRGRRDITAVAVAALDADAPTSPCGACRQVLSEFCLPDTPLYYDDGRGGFLSSTVGRLLPMDSLHDLKNRGGD